MICFLSSSPMIPGTETLNSANGFTLELRRYVPENCRALFICSDPDLPDKTDFFAASAASASWTGGTKAGPRAWSPGRT